MTEKKNTTPQRVDAEFEKMIRQVQGKYLLKGKSIKFPRVTLAIRRQYDKYPNLLKELEDGIK